MSIRFVVVQQASASLLLRCELVIGIVWFLTAEFCSVTLQYSYFK